MPRDGVNNIQNGVDTDEEGNARGRRRMRQRRSLSRALELFVSGTLLCLCTTVGALVVAPTSDLLLAKNSETRMRASSTRLEDMETSSTVAPSSSSQPDDNNDMFTTLASRTASCLYESDLRRDDDDHPKMAGKNQKAVNNNWIIHDHTALRQTLDQLCLKKQRTDVAHNNSWMRWCSAVPAPTVVDLSESFWDSINQSTSAVLLERTDQRRKEFLSRMQCRLLLLPSGGCTKALSEPTDSVIFGKLLYGGVSRFRPLTNRRADLCTEIQARAADNVPAWMMFGGQPRMYEAVDMGPAAVLEVILVRRGKELETISLGGTMAMRGMNWEPKSMFDYHREEVDGINGDDVSFEGGYQDYSPSSLSGKRRNDAFRSELQSTVGGLQPQIDAIVRRVLDGRIIQPVQDAVTSGDTTARELQVASLEAEELALLGLTPVRGLLLYGPPGCGKTALSRQLSQSLQARSPKIVSAPELLDRWVGGSEKLVRGLFADAEAELASCQGDATKSALHVIVIDEIDAVFRKRTSAEDSGEATRSSVVNQILAKLDGVNSIPNVLLIGMTNRRELLDEALLRPGRLEVQIEIPLPSKEGRREILAIHFAVLRHKGRLSLPLCCAIDGVPLDSAVSQEQVVKDKDPGDCSESQDVPSGLRRNALARTVRQVLEFIPSSRCNVFDLASNGATGGFSGADIAGLVRCAGSLALVRSRKSGSGVDGLTITLEDVKRALHEVKEQR